MRPDGGHRGNGQVAALEQENVTLRHTLQQRTQQMKGMQGRVAALELEANEATEKARHAVEEQSKLVRTGPSLQRVSRGRGVVRAKRPGRGRERNPAVPGGA